MCGITGLAFSVSKESPTAEAYIEEMGSLFSDLLISIENRGGAATGVAILNKGGHIFYAKNNVKATEFITTEQYQELMDNLCTDTIGIIGHTRTPTYGAPEDNNNNHPHLAGNTVGVHNGTITNYVDLESEWKLYTKGMCDSEVIFRLYDWAREKCQFTNKKALELLSEQLNGGYACAFFTLYEPDSLILFRGYGSLDTLIAEDEVKRQVYIFNSERSNIHSVLNAYKNLTSTKKTFVVDSDSYLKLNPITWKAEECKFKGGTNRWAA